MWASVFNKPHVSFHVFKGGNVILFKWTLHIFLYAALVFINMCVH